MNFVGTNSKSSPVLEHRPAQQGLRLNPLALPFNAACVLEHRPAQQGLRHSTLYIFRHSNR